MNSELRASIERAIEIARNQTKGRETSLVVTKLEEALHWVWSYERNLNANTATGEQRAS
jgi:hypothetical protein